MPTLTLLHWPWNEPLVEENLAIFAALYPRLYGSAVTVARRRYDWPAYPQQVRKHLAAGQPADVVYVSDEWKAEWIRDGLLVPLEEHYPPAATYRRELVSFALEGCSHQGKLYGLPYYADVYGLVYNRRLLEQVGLAAPPADWAQLLEACARLKKDLGLEKPLWLGFGYGGDVTYPMGVDLLQALALAMTGRDLFDADLRLDDADAGPLAVALEWIQQARDQAAVLDPAGAEAGLYRTVDTARAGAHAFTLMPIYCLRRTVMHGRQALHPEFRLAPMPGSGRTLGYTRVYGLTAQALQRGPAVAEAAARLIEFLGGRSEVTGRSQYFVPKKWALVDGLGPAPRCLYDDPDIADSFRPWVDLEVYRQYSTMAVPRLAGRVPWWSRWQGEAARLLAAFAEGTLPAVEVRRALAEGWRRAAAS